MVAGRDRFFLSKSTQINSHVNKHHGNATDPVKLIKITRIRFCWLWKLHKNYVVWRAGAGGGGWRETTPISITRKKSAFSRNFELICGQTKKTHSQSTFNRVRTHLESPWKLQSVLGSPWISVLTLSNTDSQVSKRSKHRKTYQDKIAHVVEEPKKTDSRLFFCTRVESLKNWKCFLASPWKSLGFFVQKGYETCFNQYDVTG